MLRPKWIFLVSLTFVVVGGGIGTGTYFGISTNSDDVQSLSSSPINVNQPPPSNTGSPSNNSPDNSNPPNNHLPDSETPGKNSSNDGVPLNPDSETIEQRDDVAPTKRPTSDLIKNLESGDNDNNNLFDSLQSRQKTRDLIQEIINNDKENLNDNQVYVITAIDYILFVLGNKDYTDLYVDGKKYWDFEQNTYNFNYEFINSINLEINDNSEKKEFLNYYRDYLRDTFLGQILGSSIYNGATSLEGKWVTNAKCFNNINLVSSNNPWKSFVGEIQYTFNCTKTSLSEDKYENYLNKLLEFGSRVIVVDGPGVVHQDGFEYMPMDKAKELSKKTNIKEGDVIVVYSDIKNWSEKMNIRMLESVIQNFSLNNLYNNQRENLKQLIYKDDKSDNSFNPLETMINFIISLLGNNVRNKWSSKLSIDSLSKEISDGIKISFKEQVSKTLFNDNAFLRFIVEQGKSTALAKLGKYSNPYKVEEMQQRQSILETELQDEKEKEATLTQELELFNIDSEKVLKYEYLKERVKQLIEEIKSVEYIVSIFDERIRNERIRYELTNNQEYQNRVLDLIIKREEKLTQKNVLEGLKDKYNDELAEIESTTQITSYLNKRNELFQTKEKLKSEFNQYENLTKIIEIELKKKNATLQIENLLNKLESTDNPAQIFINSELEISLETFSILFETTLLDIFESLGLAEKISEFEYKTNFDKLIQGSSSAISELFKNKSAITNLNKMISAFNNMTKNVTTNSALAISKLLNLIIPRSFYEFLNSEISIFDYTFYPKNGVDIKDYEIYGKIVGGTTSGTTAVGFLTGLLAGAKKGKKLIYGLIGGLIGLVAGGLVSSTVTYSMFGDGNLHLERISKKGLELLNMLSQSKSQRKSFNLLVDGDVFIKNNYNKQLNDIFKTLGKIFIEDNFTMQEGIKRFNDKYKNQKMSGEELLGEVIKNIILSSQTWSILTDSNNYQINPTTNIQELTEEAREKIMHYIQIDWLTLQEMIPNNNKEYIDELFNLQSEFINYFLFQSLESKPNTRQTIIFGYNSSEFSKERIKDLNKKVLKSLQTENRITFSYVDLDLTPNAYYDMKFTYSMMDRDKRNFLQLDIFEQRKLMNTGAIKEVPIWRVPLVIFAHKKSGFTDVFLDVLERK